MSHMKRKSAKEKRDRKMMVTMNKHIWYGYVQNEPADEKAKESFHRKSYGM